MAIKKKEKTKVNRKEAEKNTKDLSCPEHPVFCFRYLTSNKRYNLSNSKEPLNKAKLFLLIKMEEMSHLTWQELFNRNHINGLESIPLSRLNFDADKELTLSKDEKFLSIRFGQQDRRIIGIKRNGCPILHIIGIDFDFSAYQH